MMNRVDIISSFSRYCEFILPQVLREKIRPFHRVMMDAIDDAINNRGPRRIIMTMPPRHWKTMIGRNCFMTYMFGRYPDRIGVYATYNEDFAENGKDEVAKILASEEYKWLFPNARTRSTTEELEDIDRSIRKTKKDTAKRISSVNSRGDLHFVGRGNALTGIGAHFLVADDLYKDQQEAESEKISRSIMDWFEKVFLTRREPKAIELIFYTRWLSNDVIGKLIEYNLNNKDPNYETYRILRFAAEKDEADFDEDTYDTRALGEPLDPDRVAEYARAKKDANTWMAMYQQKPLDVKGLLFELGLFGRYSYPMVGGLRVISVDANYTKDSQTTDRTGITVWKKINNKYYLERIINRKMNYTELRTVVSNLAQEYSDYWAIVIEEAANGVALIDDMRTVFPRIIGVKPHGKTKRERAQMILPVVQSGGVMIPTKEICDNIDEFMTEVSRFTGTQKNEKDDLVDSMVMAITYFEQFAYLHGSTLIDTIPRQQALYTGQQRVPMQERGRWQQNVVEVQPNPRAQPGPLRVIN